MIKLLLSKDIKMLPTPIRTKKNPDMFPKAPIPCDIELEH